MIYYIVTKRQFKLSEIPDVRTPNSANIGSDHALLKQDRKIEDAVEIREKWEILDITKFTRKRMG